MSHPRSNLIATVPSTPNACRSRKQIVAIAASALVASSVLFTASPAFASGRPLGGIVNADGSINTGTGFSVSHDGTGKYTIDVPAGHFTNCPVILVTPAGYTSEFPIINDYDYITCGGSGEVKMQIRVWGRKDGAAQDNAFHFLMIKS